jgi:signal transduction histidine kinase
MVAALTLVAVYLLLCGGILQLRTRRSRATSWLLVYMLYSAALMGLHAAILSSRITFMPPLSTRLAITAGFALGVGLAGMLTLAYLTASRALAVGTAVAVGAWVTAIVVAGLVGAPSFTSTQPWLNALLGQSVTLSAEIAILGFVGLSAFLFGQAWRGFLTEPLPLYANRHLYWSVILPFLLIGSAVSAWVFPAWNYIGYGIHLMGVIGAAYGVTAHRLVDLREAVRWAVNHTIFLAVSALLFYVAIVAALTALAPPSGGPGGQAALVGLALAAAAFFVLLTELVRWLVRNLMSRSVTDPAEVVERYSRSISRVIELDRLAEAVTRPINELLGTRGGTLIVATRHDSRVLLEQVRPGAGSSLSPGMLSVEGPIYRRFVDEKRPLLQYDIDYHQQFAAAADDERQYFSQLAMDIYAPIVGDDELIGLLAVGPKANDAPFRPGEIDLLAALANQTVVALENARLVRGLRELNERISALNEDLTTTNERLQRLDSVKTDFLTIASHELRTPLTQLQGYSDLLQEMVGRGLAEIEEVETITRSLGQATRRLTGVITALMDVTEIDIQSMDLDFTRTDLSAVVKAAVEPYAEAIEERRQVLTARGLRSLPLIFADQKRLTQVFVNLITNAIKFTPDGGEIEVVGQVYEKDNEGNPLSVRVTVRDSGIGIDRSYHQLIFEKFFRVGPVNLHSTGITKFKGAGPGLGLPIAKSIVEGHGGRIWVESPGCDEEHCPGSVFHVVLPVQPLVMAARQRLEAIHASKEETLVGSGSAQDTPPAEA